MVAAPARDYPSLVHERTQRVPPGTKIRESLLALRTCTDLIIHEHTITAGTRYMWEAPEYAWFRNMLQSLLSCSTRVTLNLDNVIGQLSQFEQMQSIPNLNVSIQFAFTKSYTKLPKMSPAAPMYQRWVTATLGEFTASYQRMRSIEALPVSNLDCVTYASAALKYAKLKKWKFRAQKIHVTHRTLFTHLLPLITWGSRE